MEWCLGTWWSPGNNMGQIYEKQGRLSPKISLCHSMHDPVPLLFALALKTILSEVCPELCAFWHTGSQHTRRPVNILINITWPSAQKMASGSYLDFGSWSLGRGKYISVIVLRPGQYDGLDHVLTAGMARAAKQPPSENISQATKIVTENGHSCSGRHRCGRLVIG